MEWISEDDFVSVTLAFSLDENHYGGRSVVFTLNPESVLCGSVFLLMRTILASNW